MVGDVLLFSSLCAVMALGLSVVAQNRLDPVSVFTVLEFPTFVLRPMMLVFGLDQMRYSFLLHDRVEPLAREAAILYGIAYIAFVIGYAIPGRHSQLLTRAFWPFRGRVMNVRRMAWAAIGLTLLGLMILEYFRAQVGSLEELAYESRHGLFAGYYVLTKVPQVATYVTALFVIVALKTGKHRRLAIGVFVFAAGLMVALGDRSGVVAPLIAVTIGYHFSIRPVPLKRLFVALTIGAALIVALGVVRKAVFLSKNQDPLTAIADASWGEVAGSAQKVSEQLNLQTVDAFLVILQDFDSSNYHWGRDFYIGLLGVVPRSIWPGKPAAINLGGWWRDTYMPGTGGKPFTAVGEWYLNFGYFGALLGPLLCGVFFRNLWEAMKNFKFAPWIVTFYIVMILRVTAFGIATTTLSAHATVWVIGFMILYSWVLVRPRAQPLRQPSGHAPLGQQRPT